MKFNILLILATAGLSFAADSAKPALVSTEVSISQESDSCESLSHSGLFFNVSAGEQISNQEGESQIFPGENALPRCMNSFIGGGVGVAVTESGSKEGIALLKNQEG